MDIKIENLESVDLVNNASTDSGKKNSAVRIFSETGNSFTLVLDPSKVEKIKKIQAALDLALDYLSK